MATQTEVPWPAKTPPATRLDPVFLTVHEVARLLKLHPNTIYRWAEEGSVPSVHLGSMVRIPRKAFYEWITAQQRHGSPMRIDRSTKQGQSRTA